MTIAQSISSATTRNELRSALADPEFDTLTLHEINESTWLVQTPVQFGGRNWVLWITFEEEQVQSVRIRTQDTDTERPKGAPDDRSF